MYTDQRHTSPYLTHASQAKLGILPLQKKLHVVTSIFNPMRWRSRYELYRAFEKHMEESGVILYTIEAAFGEREFEVTAPDNPRHIRVRCRSEIFIKENLLNAAIAAIPDEGPEQGIAWIDADVRFQRPDWAQETLHLLQHYHYLQLFTHSTDLGPNYEPVNHFTSFAHGYREAPLEVTRVNGTSGYYGHPASMQSKRGLYWHPGFAHAARRSTLDAVGGLIDQAVVGGADWLMMNALIGQMSVPMNRKFTKAYKQIMFQWQERAEKFVRRNIGCVPGHLVHFWHGKKVNRSYPTREQVLINNAFDPIKDLRKDSRGIYYLNDDGTHRFIQLREGLRQYLKTRNEDSVDL